MFVNIQMSPCEKGTKQQVSHLASFWMQVQHQPVCLFSVGSRSGLMIVIRHPMFIVKEWICIEALDYFFNLLLEGVAFFPPHPDEDWRDGVNLIDAQPHWKKDSPQVITEDTTLCIISQVPVFSFSVGMKVTNEFGINFYCCQYLFSARWETMASSCVRSFLDALYHK